MPSFSSVIGNHVHLVPGFSRVGGPEGGRSASHGFHGGCAYAIGNESAPIQLAPCHRADHFQC